MRRITRRLDHETTEIEIGRQAAFGHDLLQDYCHPGVKFSVNVHGRGLTQFRRHVKKPHVLG